jgi:hypothetical protein
MGGRRVQRGALTSENSTLPLPSANKGKKRKDQSYCARAFLFCAPYGTLGPLPLLAALSMPAGHVISMGSQIRSCSEVVVVEL